MDVAVRRVRPMESTSVGEAGIVRPVDRQQELESNNLVLG